MHLKKIIVATIFILNTLLHNDIYAQVNVAILDSGINLNSSEFEGRIIKPYNADKDNNEVQDYEGHGSHIAGIIGAADNGRGVTGIAPEVNIMPVKVLEEKDDLESIVKGIKYACENGADIVNCSFTITPQSKDRYYIDWKNFRIIDRYEELYKESEIKNTIESYPDVLFVFAAGNEYRSKANFPARYNLDNIISVGAVDDNNKIWKKSIFERRGSNFGEGVDIYAPGVNIDSVGINGIEERTGTSMAAAYVSGVAALLKQEYPQASSLDIKKATLDSSIKTNNLISKVYSQGIVDLDAAIKELDNILRKKA